MPFKNVIYDYPLGKAMADGFVKEPAVVTRKNFDASGMAAEEVERLKLEDGVRLHESLKVELETYARETGNPIVKPFLLVIARDTTHAGQLMQLIRSDVFFEGRYRTKVIQVDSSRTGAEEDEMIQRLLAVESTEEPTEIVIHVNMLKEGWDVTNLYTIVPLRAANARILIEQSIGRGLRLPYGRRTGVAAVDRLNIVAHDRFQEIIDEANRPDSAIRLQQVVLDPDQLQQKTVTVVSVPILDIKLGLQPAQTTASMQVAGSNEPPAFQTPQEQEVAQITREVIRKLENQPQKVPSLTYLQKPDVQAMVQGRRRREYRPTQLEMEGVTARPDIATVVAKTTELVIQQTISIPRILVLPKGEVRSGFHPFRLELGTLNYPTPSEELWIQYLRTNQLEVRRTGQGRDRGSAARRLYRQRSGGLRRCGLRRSCRFALRPGGAGCSALPQLPLGRGHAKGATPASAGHRPVHPCPDAGPLLGGGGGLRGEDQPGVHRIEAERLHRSGAGASARFPTIARRQEQHGEVFVRGLQPLPLFGGEVPVGCGAKARGNPGTRILEVVQAGSGTVPDLLPLGCGPSGIPTGFRGGDGWGDLHVGTQGTQ